MNIFEALTGRKRIWKGDFFIKKFFLNFNSEKNLNLNKISQDLGHRSEEVIESECSETDETDIISWF